jgi:glycosyltransferase involved in cell wall biosynthesis
MMTEKEFIKDKVTVVIPVYNEERFLRQALESVVEQVDCVILGDNCSTDGTEAICREFAEKYPYVKYFRHEKNFGGAYNGSFCYKQVEMEFVFHIGGHDLVPPNYVSELKKTLKANPDAICAYADCQYIDCDGKNLIREEYNNPQSQCFRGKMVAPYLADERPLIRASEFILHDYPCPILYGLCRTQKIITEWTIARPIAGPDLVALFNILLSGKFIYSSATEFYLRDVHQTLTSSTPECIFNAYMARIVGYETKINYKPMVDLIMKSFNDAEIGNLTSRELRKYRIKIRLLFYRNFRYSGNFMIDFYGNIHPKIFYFRKIWKILCRSFKSVLIPGYAEKKRKQAEMKKL